MNQSQPIFVLPPESEDPDHPLHDLFVMFQENERHRTSIPTHLPTPSKPAACALQPKRIPNPGDAFRVNPADVEPTAAAFHARRAAFQRSAPRHRTAGEMRAALAGPPDAAFVAALDYVHVNQMVGVLADVLSGDSEYPAPLLAWAEAVLAAVEDPVDQSTAAALRRILCSVCRARHALVRLAPRSRAVRPGAPVAPRAEPARHHPWMGVFAAFRWRRPLIERWRI